MTRRAALDWLGRTLGVGLTIFAIWAALHYPWSEAGAALRQTTPAFLGLALVVNLVSLLARAWSWHLLLNPAARNRLRIAFEATVLGAAVGSLSVAVAGEGTRVRFLSRREAVPASLAVAALVWSRVTEAVALTLVLLIVPFFLQRTEPLRILQLGAALALVVILIYLVVRRRMRLPARLPAFVRRSLATMSEIPAHSPTVVAPLALSLVHWFTQWITYHLAFVSTGLVIPPSASFGALVLANVAWMFRLTPGNVGVMQGSIAIALLPFGVDVGKAVVAGLALQAIQVIPVILLAATLTGVRGLRQLLASEADRAQP
jgi:glycosyltransferase 2 family protein